MSTDAPMLFALDATEALGSRVAAALGIELARHEARDFDDGEHKLRPLDCVRGHDVYVLSSLYGDAASSVNDKLVRLLFFLGAVCDAGAARVTAVLPYLCYARKDVRTQPDDPLPTRYVAQLLEALGVDRVLVIEAHNPAAFQNAFRISAEHLSCSGLFADAIAARLPADTRLVVVSPDPGGFKRADRLRSALARRLQQDIGLAMMEKRRALGTLEVGRLAGDVAGATAIIVDDILATGSTLAASVAACRAQSAIAVIAAAAHGLFVAPAAELLAADALPRVLITDTVAPFRLDEAARSRVEVIGVASLLANAIGRLAANASLGDLGR